MREYIAKGPARWLIDPRTDTVEIYRPGQLVETLTRPATLSGRMSCRVRLDLERDIVA
jgi:Uma2 family endonuclease